MEALRKCVETRNVPFEGYTDRRILIRSSGLVRVSPTLASSADFFYLWTSLSRIWSFEESRRIHKKIENGTGRIQESIRSIHIIFKDKQLAIPENMHPREYN